MAIQPYSGPSRNDILPGLRQLVIGNYIAFYRVDNGDVVILRLLHGKQDQFGERFSDID